MRALYGVGRVGEGERRRNEDLSEFRAYEVCQRAKAGRQRWRGGGWQSDEGEMADRNV